MHTPRRPGVTVATAWAPIGAGLLLVAALAGWVPVGSSAPLPGSLVPTQTNDQVSYATDIDPIFQASCVRCHGGEDDGQPRLEASLNLTTYEGVMAGSEFGSVVEPGDPDASILLEMVAVGDMPEEGDPLTPEQIEAIRTWIAEGAQNN